MARIFEVVFFFQAEDGIRDVAVTGVQTCALPIYERRRKVCVYQAPAGGAPPAGPAHAAHTGRLSELGGSRQRRMAAADGPRLGSLAYEIGRASCRERVWLSVRGGAVEGRGRCAVG